MDEDAVRARIAEFDAGIGWYQDIDLGNGVHTKSRRIYGEEIDHPRRRWAEVESAVPQDLIGKTVLDIGCNAGYICFEAVRRGAKRVVGIDLKQDYVDQANFCAEVLGVDVDFRVMSIYDLAQLDETFDVVFCVGILYHCADILSAVSSVSSAAADLLIVETAIEPIESDLPLVRYSRVSQFSPAFEGGNGLPGHWHPNFTALESFFAEQGFTSIERLFEVGRRGGIVARR